MKTLSGIFLVIICLGFGAAVSAQCPPKEQMPAGTVCITQEAANVSAANVRELAATKEKIIVLQDGLIARDKTIAENKVTADKNEADLKAQLHKTEVDLALKTGMLIKAEQQHNDDQAEKKQLIDKIRKRCSPFSICVN